MRMKIWLQDLASEMEPEEPYWEMAISRTQAFMRQGVKYLEELIKET